MSPHALPRAAPGAPCPHAKPDEPCVLPPGTRYCVCASDLHREPVGQVVVEHGQIVWFVPGPSGRRGTWTFVATVRQGAMAVPVALRDDPALHEIVEGGRARFEVRGLRDERFQIEASALLRAALARREDVDATPLATR